MQHGITEENTCIAYHGVEIGIGICVGISVCIRITRKNTWAAQIWLWSMRIDHGLYIGYNILQINRFP
jgi:hypothetical protein